MTYTKTLTFFSLLGLAIMALTGCNSALSEVSDQNFNPTIIDAPAVNDPDFVIPEAVEETPEPTEAVEESETAETMPEEPEPLPPLACTVTVSAEVVIIGSTYEITFTAEGVDEEGVAGLLTFHGNLEITAFTPASTTKIIPATASMTEEVKTIRGRIKNSAGEIVACETTITTRGVEDPTTAEPFDDPHGIDEIAPGDNDDEDPRPPFSNEWSNADGLLVSNADTDQDDENGGYDGELDDEIEDIENELKRGSGRDR